MVQALEHEKAIDHSIWLRDSKDEEEDWERRRKRPYQAPIPPPSKRKKSAPRPERQIGALLRAACALSEREDLTKHADTLADYLGVSRESLYSMTLAEFIERHESAQLTQEINDAYDEELEQEDEEFLAHVKSYQGRVLNAED
jgi:hypothetical protein